MQLSLYQLLGYRTVYSHPKDAFFSAIVGTVHNHPKDAFLLLEYAIVGLPVVSLSDSLQPSKGCVPLAIVVISLQIIDLSDGLQSSKGCTEYCCGVEAWV